MPCHRACRGIHLLYRGLAAWPTPGVFKWPKGLQTIHPLRKGIVTKSTGSWYQVLMPEGETIECRIVGKLRLDGLKTTNPVAVGDEVLILEEGDGKGLIKEVLPRRNYVVRQSPRKKHDLHLLASNVDQAVLISTIIGTDTSSDTVIRRTTPLTRVSRPSIRISVA